MGDLGGSFLTQSAHFLKIERQIENASGIVTICGSSSVVSSVSVRLLEDDDDILAMIRVSSQGRELVVLE